MPALAILVITLAAEQTLRVRISYPPPDGLIELTVPEIRRLINAALAKPVRLASVLA